MKILRKHRGFTTNSSSASEWLIPGKPLPGANTNANGTNATATSTNPPPLAPTRTQIVRDNTAMVVGLLCAVVGVFAVERVVRRLLKKRRVEEDL